MDYHAHTCLSWDSAMTPGELVRRAVELGIGELAVTDHVEFDPTYHGFGAYDYEGARRAVAAAAGPYRGRINVAFGAEISFEARHVADIVAFLDRSRFDFLIGSVHGADGVDFSAADPEELRGLPRDPLVALKPYFREVRAAAESHMFDVIGHLEGFLRGGGEVWGPGLADAAWPAVRQCLKAIAASGTGIEVNASGLRQRPKQLLPAERALAEYFTLGGRRVTVGSDAHRVDCVGSGVEQATAALRRAGFRCLTAFRDRLPVAVPL